MKKAANIKNRSAASNTYNLLFIRNYFIHNKLPDQTYLPYQLRHYMLHLCKCTFATSNPPHPRCPAMHVSSHILRKLCNIWKIIIFWKIRVLIII